MKINLTTLAILTALSLGVGSASAQTAITISGTGGGTAPDNTAAGQGLIGFEFTVNQDIDVTSLDFYALSLSGGDAPHVAILNVTGGFSNPPTVVYDTGDIGPSSNPDVANDPGWNSIAITGPAVELVTGQTYEISAPAYWSSVYNSESELTLGSAISSITYLKGGGWNGWDSNNGATGQVYDYTAQSPVTSNIDLDANFTYTPVVPEPSVFAALVTGAAGLLMFRRRKA